MAERLAGRLLVAAPTLLDPNFSRTVVLILEHNDDGALGLVLNRETATPVGEPLPQWAALAAEPTNVFAGGPVEPTAAICLATVRSAAEPARWQRLHGLLGVLDLGAEPAEFADTLVALRVFAGYAGWGSGQLEIELEVGGWYVVAAQPTDPLSAAPDRLWRDVLGRQRGSLKLVANFPPDPRLN